MREYQHGVLILNHVSYHEEATEARKSAKKVVALAQLVAPCENTTYPMRPLCIAMADFLPSHIKALYIGVLWTENGFHHFTGL